MGAIITKALSFLLLIVAGYLFRQFGLIKKEFGVQLAVLSIKLLLPATIMASFASFKMDYSILVLFLFGILGNLLILLIGFVVSLKRERKDKIYYMVSGNSYNIGNFALPFVSSFFGPIGIISTSIFDAGNSIMLLGLNCPFAEMLSGRKEGQSGYGVSYIMKRLFSAPAFDCYMIMLIFSMLKIQLPAAFFSICSEIGKANGPVAMFMIGAMLEIHFDKRYLKMTAAMLLIRFSVAATLMLIISRFSFLPEDARIAGMIIIWAPIGSASAANTALLGGDTALSAFVNTISLIMSLIIIPVLVMVL